MLMVVHQTAGCTDVAIANVGRGYHPREVSQIGAIGLWPS